MAKNANWERTLGTLAKHAKVQRTAEQVAARLGSEITGFIYQQIWRGMNVLRWADTAHELPHDKPGQSEIKHFIWLCQRESGAGRTRPVTT